MSNFSEAATTRPHGIVIYIDYKNPVVISTSQGILGSDFLLPVIILGVIGNLTVITRMPAAEGISKKLKMFYIVIAFADFGVLTVIHALSMFPAFGIGYWTGGAVQWTALNVTKSLMVTVYDLWDVTKAISAWTLALLSIERTTVVMRPFAAQKWTFKRSAILLACVNTWAVCVPAFTTTFFFQFITVWGISIVHLLETVLANIIPLIIIIACGVFLLPINVLKRVQQRKHMIAAGGQDKGNSSALSSTEVRNSIALATVNAVYALSVGVPHSVDLAFVLQIVDKEKYDEVFALARYMQFFSSIAYAANGYIYVIHLPSFRKAVFGKCCAK